METNISPFPNTSDLSQAVSNREPGSSEVVNLGMYRLKKSLQREGFEIVEDKKGRITLVVRVSR